ncbi:hypothetical protein GCM10011386_38960 [Parapedobacter defluvii]|uniref:Uncharacterized protein n=1 Tax=Parapedobacter defluvii TaxID=2045106 RepID=A0ABQ1MMH7_9SPHI|nr:hypothetical protein GCM10011386_38960 [Parapedobacter defluvii]
MHKYISAAKYFGLVRSYPVKAPGVAAVSNENDFGAWCEITELKKKLVIRNCGAVFKYDDLVLLVVGFISAPVVLSDPVAGEIDVKSITSQ